MTGRLAPLALLIALVAASTAEARVERLLWRQDDASNVEGWTVHLGFEAGQYTTDIDLGKPALGSDGLYRFDIEVADADTLYAALTAHNAGGRSGFSNAIITRPPPPDPEPDPDPEPTPDPDPEPTPDPDPEPTPDPDPDPTGPPPTAGSGAPYFVNAGGPPSLEAAGVTWVADDPFRNRGSARTVTDAIAGTEDDALYQSERWGGEPGLPLSYRFRVSPATYRVVLHFAETYDRITTPDMRLFDVEIEGVKVLEAFDIFATVGPYRAYTTEFDVDVNDESLAIDFLAITSQTPRISAIEIYEIEATPPEEEPLQPPKAPILIPHGTQ